MAFKIVSFVALLAVTNATGYFSPAYMNPHMDDVARTIQNVVRSFGGTMSSYSKAVETPYPSNRNTNTRVNNNYYLPSVGKTMSYDAPTVTKTTITPSKAVFEAHTSTVYNTPPAARTSYAAPNVARAPVVYAQAAKSAYAASTPAHAPADYATPPASRTLYAAPNVAPAPAVYDQAVKSAYAKPAPAHAPTTGNAPYVYPAPAVTKTSYAAAEVTQGPAVYTGHAANVYATSAVTKTVYAAPTVAQAPVTYSHAAPATYSHVAPATYSHAAPATYSYASPAVYSYAAPTVTKTATYAASAATTSFNHGPSAASYTHNAPGVSGYGTSQTIHYSPAEMVSHMSFDGFGAHYSV